MDKTKATLSVVNPPADGVFHVGDTVQFAADTDGVISYACTNDSGTVLLGGGLVRGDTDFVVGMSEKWTANPEPLTCKADLLELRKGRVVTLASAPFNVAP